MTNIDFDKIPVLGVGMGYRKNYLPDILKNIDKIDFLEIIPNHFFNHIDGKSSKNSEEFKLINKYFPLIPHGLSLSIGSAEGINQDYMLKIKKIIELTDCPWWSEHICFTSSDGIDIGHLAEMPFVQESIDVISDNIDVVKKHIQTPMILENITYTIGFGLKDIPEEQFVNILERNNCGMLLDVTNLYANCLNHKYNPYDYLDTIPLDRVVQLHFVGGNFAKDGSYIDSHSYKTPEDIWRLMDEVISRCPNLKGVILERDNNFPEIDELLEELERARKIGRKYKRWT